MTESDIPPGVDPTTPSAGRLYDLFLGGSEHLEVDRKAAGLLMEKVPELPDIAWVNRGFLQRAASWMASAHGVDQFIDVGAGLPTRNNTHEAAQGVRPSAKVAYVDNDPMVLAHAKRLLEGTENVIYVSGEFRNPVTILNNAEVRGLIRFDRPIGLMLVALTHFVSDADNPWGLVRRYMDALPSGSFLALSHITSDKVRPEGVRRMEEVYENASERLFFRTKAEISKFFDGLEMIPPYEGAEADVTYVGLWGCEDPVAADSEEGRWGYVAVGRKP